MVITLQNRETLEQARRAADAAEATALWTAALTVVTLLLVAGAVAAAIYAKRTWQSAHGELELARTLARRQEASRVTAWLKPGAPGTWSVRVRNTNPGAVYDLRLVITVRTVSEAGDISDRPLKEPIKHGALGPWDESSRQNSDQITTIGRDGDPFPATRGTSWSGLDGESGVSVEITFRDSAGIYWRRDGRGVLIELDNDLNPLKEQRVA